MTNWGDLSILKGFEINETDISLCVLLGLIPNTLS